MLQCWKGFFINVLSNHHLGGHINEVYPKCLGNKGEGPRSSQVTLNYLERLKFKRRERMVRANDKNVNCAPCHLGSSCIGWEPALFLVSSFLPTTWFLPTGFLETSIFEFWLFPPHFHNSIPHTADRFVNATFLLESLQWISNARSLLESLQWISMTLDYSLVLERLLSIFPSQYTRLCYLVPLAWSQAFFLCLPSSFP